MLNYTKGDWYIWHTNNAGDIIQTTNKQVAIIVGAYGWDEKAVKESLANANLISASPDMYEALKDTQTLLEPLLKTINTISTFQIAPPGDEWMKQVLVKVNSALNKAEGKI